MTQRNKKFTPSLIILLIVSVLLFLTILIPWPHSTTQPKKITHSQGGITIPTLTDKDLNRVTNLVTLTLTWSKTDGTVHQPSAHQLEKAGMSHQLAISYQPVWNSVFANTSDVTLTDVQAQPVASETVRNTTTLTDHTLLVTTSINPGWMTADKSTVLVGRVSVDYTIHYNLKTHQITQISEPDPHKLPFAIPEGAPTPQPSPEGKQKFTVIPPGE